MGQRLNKFLHKYNYFVKFLNLLIFYFYLFLNVIAIYFSRNRIADLAKRFVLARKVTFQHNTTLTRAI